VSQQFVFIKMSVRKCVTEPVNRGRRVVHKSTSCPREHPTEGTCPGALVRGAFVRTPTKRQRRWWW